MTVSPPSTGTTRTTRTTGPSAGFAASASGSPASPNGTAGPRSGTATPSSAPPSEPSAPRAGTAAPSDRPDTVDLYRKHIGSGRAVMGRVMGGMAEIRSEGVWIHTDDGRRFLDFGGYGVFIMGHRHPAVVEAVHRQIDTHPLASRVLLEPVAARAAQALAAHTPPGLDYVHFVNSGAEATEAALKLARAHGLTSVITTRSGFHGKTLGALSVTANATYQTPFQPLLPDVTQVAYDDPADLEQALAAQRDRACVIVEPVQGEGGVRIPTPGYLGRVRALCQEYGALLVVDEIQTGMGRLGTWWGVDAEGVRPDVLLVGKGLSGGVVPVAAMVATAEAYAPFSRDPYLHTSTFGASPIACAAALATVRAMEEEDTVARAAALGPRILAAVRDVCAPYRGGLVREVRGRGLLIGVEFAEEQAVGELMLELISRGVLVNNSLNSTRVLRLTPPAVVEDSALDLFLTTLGAALRGTADRMTG
ncbi:aminotransferase class III-fold pyridoxal phosphate-dependent enzyme [Streptomyces sp. G3]|uniref:aspartate aminotransferase family protein n=1 Tax=Streptomyces sp. G3 TaxID=690144 RepID=UPI00202E630C|nr:aminotransferase class III-fold pyridoxal phosphate-dependent enzyme [Streptomyces sp. G3]MCM1937169.1 aminotransferase class III-fold pyridoxal phosphate-dependent enzyme [Streptomyces sp. G3]